MCEDINEIHLSPDRLLFQAFGNMVMYLRAPKKDYELFYSL
jgi:hypothetical protein